MKNKEEKNRKYLGKSHLVIPVWVRKSKEIQIKPRVGLAFGDWLIVFLVKQNIYNSQKLSKFQYASEEPQAGVAPTWAQKVMLIKGRNYQ